MACECSVTSKAFIAITSFIFWAAAGGLIFIGAWVYKEYQHYNLIAESLYTLVPATILMAVGVFFFLLGIVGCVGACKEQKCLLGIYFTILLLILVGMVSAAVIGYIKHGEVESQVNDGIHEGMRLYANDTNWRDQIDFMQSELKCCGCYNFTDWQDTPYGKIPDTCCDKNTNCSITNNQTNVYQSGCLVLVKDQFMTHLGVISGVSAGFAIVLICGMIFSCVLICKRRSEVPYIGLREPSGMRV